MSNPESVRHRIAEEEAKLARIEKDREDTLARLQELKGPAGSRRFRSHSAEAGPVRQSTLPVQGPVHTRREGRPFPEPLPGPGGRLPEAVGKNQDRPERIRPRLLQRMGGRGLPEAPRQVRQVFPSGVPPGHRPGRPRPSSGPPRNRSLPASAGRDVLVPGGRFRRTHRGRRT